jgi:hypothetical protein
MFQNLHRMLRGGRTLDLTCGACGHSVRWGPGIAFQRLGPDATPFEVRRKLVCSRCGAAEVLVRI